VVHHTFIAGDDSGEPRRRRLRAVDTPPEGLPDPELVDVDPQTTARINGAWSVEVPETDEEVLLREAFEDDPDDNTAPDGPDAARWKPPVESRPFLPAWWHSDQRWEVIAWHANYRAREAVRLVVFLASLYWLRALRRTPRGIGATVAATWRWVFDHESLPIRQTLRDSNSQKEFVTWLAVSRQRNERVSRRGTWVLVGAAVLAGYAAVVWFFGQWWLKTVTVMVALIVFGKAGSDAADPIIDRRRIIPRVRKLDAGVIERAFEAAGLASDKRPISIPIPIVRDGPGWAAVIDLDFHYTAEQAIKRRQQIAAGLDFDETQVWLDRVRGTAGSARRLKLWVCDEDPFEQSSGPWPLLRAGTVDVFSPFPFGTDQRGTRVDVSCMFTSMLIGSVPRIGKTAAGRLIALAWALDPVTELHLWDGKGGSDWREGAGVAHRCGFGPRTEVAQTLLADLLDVQKRMNDRYDQVAKLGTDLCPDSQVTRDLAERRGLALWPVGIFIDEFQRYTGHPEFGEKIVEVLIDIAKVGPAVGIFLCLMTQKPDATSVPSALRDVIGTRFALHVRAWQASDCILGAGAHVEGYDSSQFRRSDKGVGWLIGADDSGAVEDARITRTYYVNTESAGPIWSRARTARTKAGLLTGVAAGQEAPPVVQDRTAVLVDVLSVWPPGQDKVANVRLAGLLADSSTRYEGWSGTDVTAALAKHGITTVQVNRQHGDGDDRRNLRGTARADVENALHGGKK
jgi:S-DNA-T family DNA segregation ATPase FtsK/SpoIIIE